MHSAPISSAPKSTRGARVVIGLFFGLFLTVGLAFGGLILGRPVLRMIDAVDWTAVPCEILASRVERLDGDEGSTYRVALTYRYHVDDRPHVGNRYKFVSMSSSGYRRKREVVDRLPAGARTTCYVNPADPSDSVVKRGPTSDLLWGIIPLVFIVVGASGVAGAILGRGPITSSLVPTRVPPTHVVYEDAPDRRQSTRLLPIHSRGAKLAGAILVALFWNGIVSVFLTEAIGNWRNNVFELVMSLFLTPFVLVGVFLLVVAVHMLLSYYNPVPLLTVNSPVLPLGGELKLRWAVDGRVEKLRRLSITLEGREEATYRRGTDTRTDKHVFASFTLVEQVSPVDMLGGSTKLPIPADTMHSFDAPNNKVVWLLRVRGDVANWPDSDEEFRITIAPRGR